MTVSAYVVNLAPPRSRDTHGVGGPRKSALGQDIAGVSNQNGWAGVIAIYLAGGVTAGNYNCSFHYGYGHMSQVPQGLESYGCIYVCGYLLEVFGLYAAGIGVPGYSHSADSRNR